MWVLVKRLGGVASDVVRGVFGDPRDAKDWVAENVPKGVNWEYDDGEWDADALPTWVGRFAGWRPGENPMPMWEIVGAPANVSPYAWAVQYRVRDGGPIRHATFYDPDPWGRSAQFARDAKRAGWRDIDRFSLYITEVPMRQQDVRVGVDLHGLFIKYIAYVRDAEGIDFITTEGGRGRSPFTNAEWGVLVRMAGAACQYDNAGAVDLLWVLEDIVGAANDDGLLDGDFRKYVRRVAMEAIDKATGGTT